MIFGVLNPKKFDIDSLYINSLYTHYLAKFRWVLFADLRLRRRAMKQNAKFTEAG